MSSKQANLVAAIADAMAAQNFSQADLARAAGCSQGMISSAMSGKYGMKEEKWRMVCEVLALDYDAIVTLPAEEPAPIVAAAEENPVAIPTKQVDAQDSHGMLCARYLAEKLRADVSAGTDMPLEDLYVLLSYIKQLEWNAP